jgi:hypothetical protein
MFTMSHGFVFWAQQPVVWQKLRSAILQQLFMSPGKATEHAWGNFYQLLSRCFACQKAMFLSWENNIPIWSQRGVSNALNARF